mgnify:CR=1 FL=1
MPDNKFGIYYNAIKNEVLRINSPYWIPDPADWTFILRDVNSTLTDIRTVIAEQNLSSDAQSAFWGVLPIED